MKKKISIIISHRHYYDGFWILPIINKLKFKYKLEIIFCNIKINNKFSDLIDKGIKIHFVNNSLFENYLNKIFGINLQFYRVKKIITGSDTVFLSYVRNSKKLDFFRNEIFKITKKEKIKLCFYPPISSDLIFTLPKKIKNNKIYVVTREQKKFLEKKKFKNIIWSGAINYNSKHISYMLNNYNKNFNHSLDKYGVLFLLKNQNSNIFNVTDFEKLITHCLIELKKTKKTIYLKPHPQQDIELIKKIISKIKMKNYQIVDYPIIYLANKIKITVSMFSGGILDVLSVRKVPFLFWPIEKFLTNKNKTDKSFHKVLGSTFSEARLYKNYSIRIKNVNEIFSEKQNKKIKILNQFQKKFENKIYKIENL